jgi:hypothetical protein
MRPLSSNSTADRFSALAWAKTVLTNALSDGGQSFLLDMVGGQRRETLGILD